MRMGHIELPVANPLESMSFYVDTLGFALESNQGDRFIWVRLGDAEILLKPKGPESASDPDAGPMHERRNICLYTNTLDDDVSRLRDTGVDIQLGDGCCYYFRDPDGHQLQLVDPSDHG